jgi:hypothetical protein
VVAGCVVGLGSVLIGDLGEESELKCFMLLNRRQASTRVGVEVRLWFCGSARLRTQGCNHDHDHDPRNVDRGLFTAIDAQFCK